MTDLAFALNTDRRAPLPQAEIARLMSLYGAGRLTDLVRNAQALATRHRPSLELYNILGAACVALGDFPGAEAAFRAAIAVDDRHAELHSNLGAALEPQDKFDEATACFHRALALNPNQASPHFNLGNLLRRQHALPQAIACYERAIALKPDYFEAHNNLGLALQEQNALTQAISCHQRALTLNPNYAEAYNNLGLALKGLGDPERAVQCYKQALALKPGCPKALHNIATVLLDINDYDGVIQVLDLLLSFTPDDGLAARQKAFAQMYVCDFSANRNLPAPVDQAAQRLATPPFIMLPFFDDGAQQLAYSRLWARTLACQPAETSVKNEPSDGRIRIGYFSADFHSHATMFLMAGLLRTHDRERFEINAYSYGEIVDADVRDQLQSQVDRLIDIRGMTDQDVANLTQSHGLDIAIDLKGYTGQSRSRLFSGRLAPVQINYLGYPGSMGTDDIDYIIADPVVIPEASRAFYSEKVIYLPGSYQPNDDQRVIAETGATRADFGLPEDGFVFCCFNHTYKICPDVFDIWMRLLDRTEGSVLWLLGSKETAKANLRKEAALRGIDPDRLIFADGLPHAEHLARLRLADLFVDTFAVNAHTTASDALWAGIPVVTLAGGQFAARVGASLLHAIGLPDLVTDNAADYEALIADLASHPQELATVRARLAENRLSQPLFDTAGYTQAIERAFETVHQRRLDGLTPADVVID
ncbi:MAG: glycosyltransferase family 41 protein [Novosphingobium sp.]|nr:MAG: glycosyltransferase family 41 protein [Novosphingobium sp.]